MKINFIKVSVLTAMVVLSACQSKQAREEAVLDKKIKNEAPANTPNQIMERAALAFASADGLTAEQKMRLSEIYKRVYTESMQIRQDIGKSKSLLFMTLAKVDYKTSDVTNLKKKIVTLDQRRLTLMFSALDEVQAIVGKGIEAEKIYRHFQEYEFPSRDIN